MRRSVSAIARAAGIIGAVVAATTGITLAIDANAPHATLTSNQVSAASADLQVGANAGSLGATVPGFSFLKMAPGQTSGAFNFSVHNSGAVALVVTGNIPTDMSTSTLDPSLITLQIDNNTDGGNITPTVADLTVSNQALPFGTLTPGQTKNFILHATLSNSLSGHGPFVLVPFDLVFTGTSP